MKHSKSTHSRWLSLSLALGVSAAALVACSSDDNPAPSTPISTAGKGGSGGDAGAGDAGEGNTGNNGGTGNNAGSTNGGSGNEAGEAGQGGSAGEAGSGPVGPECTLKGDDAFLNQPVSGFNDKFDNTKRLGAHATLPPLP